MGYQPIEAYGVIGDLYTVALVSTRASIDYLPFPQFDSPTVFARLLDENKGGYFEIAPEHDGVITKQLYLPDTNVLLTRFLSQHGRGRGVRLHAGGGDRQGGPQPGAPGAGWCAGEVTLP